MLACVSVGSSLACGGAGTTTGTGAGTADPGPLMLVAEKKLSTLLPGSAEHIEASGVTLLDGSLRIASDDMTMIATVATDLTSGFYGPGEVVSSQYEAITATDDGRLFVMVETVSPSDTRAKVVELDASGAFVGERFTDVTFATFNKGFEGIAWVRLGETEHLLALCQENLCGDTTDPGHGRVAVLILEDGTWRTEVTIAVPSAARFIDYSDLALRAQGDGTYAAAIVSRKSAELWLGTLTTSPWAFADGGGVYSFPKTDDGQDRYCTVEGVTFLGPSLVAVVSDRGRGGAPCSDEDESVHIFRIP